MKTLLALVRLGAWLSSLAIIVLSVVPPQLRPETGAPHDFEHLASFAICGFAFGLGYRARLPFVAAALVGFAGVVEFVQTFVPGRHARLEDFLVDAAAACISALIAGIIASRAITASAGAPPTQPETSA
jgi:hypothetical protein